MKDQMKLAIALSEAFKNAETANDRWAVLNRSTLILDRAQKRAMHIRPENNRRKNAVIVNNEPCYLFLNNTATRLRNSMSDPKVVPLKFG